MYKYKLLNNHYVVEIDNRHYIIDTGYPYSVTFRNDLNVVKVNNHFYSLMPSFLVSYMNIIYFLAYICGLLPQVLF